MLGTKRLVLSKPIKPYKKVYIEHKKEQEVKLKLSIELEDMRMT